jgi:hypothetical protein
LAGAALRSLLYPWPGGRIKNVIGRLFGQVGTLIGAPVGCEGEPEPDDLEKAKSLGIKLAKEVT